MAMRNEEYLLHTNTVEKIFSNFSKLHLCIHSNIVTQEWYRALTEKTLL